MALAFLVTRLIRARLCRLTGGLLIMLSLREEAEVKLFIVVKIHELR